MGIEQWFLILFLLIALIPFWRRVRGRVHDARLLQHGVRTRARLLVLQETGRLFRDGPLMDIRVSFDTPERGRVEAAQRAMVTFTQLQRIKPGESVDIAYDRNDPNRFVLLPDTALARE